MGGVQAKDFWELTPYQTSIIAAAHGKRTRIDAWNNAIYARIKELPEIEEVLGLELRPSTFEEMVKATEEIKKTFGLE